MFDHTRLFISVFSNMLCHYIFHVGAFLHCFDIKLISKEVKFMDLIYRMIQIAFLFAKLHLLVLGWSYYFPLK